MQTPPPMPLQLPGGYRPPQDPPPFEMTLVLLAQELTSNAFEV